MSVRVTRGYETEYPESARAYFNFMPAEVFKKRRLPYESIFYGPLLFALPIPDRDPNTPIAGARWQFALDCAPGAEGKEIVLERKVMPKKWDWPLDAPLALKVPACAFDWKPTDAQALPERPVEGKTPESIRLVPYGCTKFRISMFPVTAKTWGENPRVGSPARNSP